MGEESAAIIRKLYFYFEKKKHKKISCRQTQLNKKKTWKIFIEDLTSSTILFDLMYFVAASISKMLPEMCAVCDSFFIHFLMHVDCGIFIYLACHQHSIILYCDRSHCHMLVFIIETKIATSIVAEQPNEIKR